MVIRAKREGLIQTRPLTEERKKNSEFNLSELKEGKTILESKPRRLVFELTNACNLNCIMCGRNAADFTPTVFKTEYVEIFKDILSEIEEITLMGWGEPTVHPDFVKLLEILDKAGVRKYFCTNGMLLGKLTPKLFEYSVDVIGISLDGSDKETNDRIRRGADFDKIVASLRAIVEEKKKRNTKYPYMNFVFTAMKSNFRQIPDMVRLAADIGLEEVKVVYLTAFDDVLAEESLWDCMDEVKKVFDVAQKAAEDLGILIKLPHIAGEDIAEDKSHKDCFTVWRDFFLGSDGYVRSCMSSPIKLFHVGKYKTFDEMWNSEEYQNFRTMVNSEKEMDDSCRRCYQSSHANWNKEYAFLQTGNTFSPKWEK